MDMQLLKDLQKQYAEGPGHRTLSQLAYAFALCDADGVDPAPAQRTLSDLIGGQRAGGVDPAGWKAAEDRLAAAYGSAAKKYAVLCAGHAHIDMNWMWGWDETVPVTLDTFETVLRLMDEFPGFTFSQSQASVYEIAERFAPRMLEEIRRRVHEGRWEVTASTWVEADRNMGTGESIVRHLLYTRQYLSRLLDISVDSMKLDFEPDTFGHGLHTPTALAQGGVRWYYHCRGFEGGPLYRWRAPSGAEILCYREPDWYLGSIDPSLATSALEICGRTGMTTALWVYGVGDHGGGPTRRDLARIVEYGTWPVFPQVRFGRMDEFYALAEKVRETLPVVEGELNFVFPGCYTTQTRIKEGDARCQALLCETEAWNALGAIRHGIAPPETAEQWKGVLFNQFHDIVTGSGVIATRERAMGTYQQVKAAAGTQRAQALRAMAADTDTSAWADGLDVSGTISEGAGVGFAAAQWKVSQTGRHAGRKRLFHVFNPSPYERDEVVELTLWDFDVDPSCLAAYDRNGLEIPCQPVCKEWNHYWGHSYSTVLVRMRVPALGRTLCVLEPRETGRTLMEPRKDARVEKPDPWTLENESVRAEFDRSGRLVSLTDKDGGELLSGPAGFRFTEEDPGRGMTAWIVGRTMRETDIHEAPVKLLALERGPLRSRLSYQIPFGEHSELNVTVSLDSGSPLLRWETRCRFLEWGTRQTYVPQLFFCAFPAGKPEKCRYDAPLGPVVRPGLPMDVPALSFAATVTDGPGLMLSVPGKHGYHYENGRLSATLIRGSFDPDPYPELGDHMFTVALGPAGSGPEAPYRLSERLVYPLSAISDGAHPGARAAAEEGLSVEGPVQLMCFKAAEDGNGYILRLSGLMDREQDVRVNLPGKPLSVTKVDLLERSAGAFDGTTEGNRLSYRIPAQGISSLRITF